MERDEAADTSARSSAAVGAGIFLSRLSGLARESLLRAVLGLGPAADAFAAALRIPNLLQNLLGEGSLSAAFIPVYSRLLGEGREEEAGRVAGAVAGLLAALAGGLVTVGIVAARPLARLLAPGFDGARLDLTTDLIRITTAGVGLLVLAAWCLGVLNSHRRFFLSYVAPVLWNTAQIAVLVAALLGDWEPANAARALAWGLVIGGLLQFGAQAVAVWRINAKIRLSSPRKLPAVKQVVRRFGPAVLGRGVLQISSYLDLMLASLLITGSVAALMSAQVLYILPISLFALSIAAAELPEMSRGPSGGKVVERSGPAMRRVAFLVLFCCVVYVMLGDMVVGALFGWGAFDNNDVIAVWFILGAYSLGLPAVGVSRIYQNALYSRGNTGGPARVAAVRMLMAGGFGLGLMFPLDQLSIVDGSLVGGNHLFDSWGPLSASVRLADGFPHLGAVGLAIGSTVGAWVELVLLSRQVQLAFDGFPRSRSVLVPLLPAAVSTGLVCVIVRLLVDDLPVHVAVSLALLAAAITYLWAGVRFGAKEAESAVKSVRRLLGR